MTMNLTALLSVLLFVSFVFGDGLSLLCGILLKEEIKGCSHRRSVGCGGLHVKSESCIAHSKHQTA